MEICVKFPISTPIEIVELYRMLELQRRELEKQRIYTQDKLLKKQGRKIFMNENQRTEDKIMIQQNEEVHFGESQQRDIHEPENGKEERLADSLMEDANQHTDVLTKDFEGDS